MIKALFQIYFARNSKEHKIIIKADYLSRAHLALLFSC